MDLPVVVIIACVFLVSLFSLLFINKFFRRKTFEEIMSEKRAMTEKIYGKSTAGKKPKKLQLKKDAKRDKKQRQRDQQKAAAAATTTGTGTDDDSDNGSETNSVEDQQPHGLSKTHVEFEPDPEVLTPSILEAKRRPSFAADKENVPASKATKGGKKDKKAAGKATGILVNKNEPVAVKEPSVVEEKLNHFDTKPPKDVVELKKQEQKQKEDKAKKGSAAAKKDNNKENSKAAAEPVVVESVAAPLTQLKQSEDRSRHGSPKAAQNSNNNNYSGSNTTTNKKQQNKKQQQQQKDQHKDLIGALDKLSDNDTVGVSLLMNLFRRSELNRSEIQILIDYLLNRQQDMPATHSEWSDDICQKLKRQLEEKEKALADEQEASHGLQAKLRDLRTEFNTERAQMNVNVKAYLEKIQSKESELAALQQELQSQADKFTVERQQFQAQLVREKQAGSQDLLAQLQLVQNELAHKEKCLSDLMNSTQQQVAQIAQLERQRDELEEAANQRIFEAEKTRTLEEENAEYKVAMGNLQNALESSKVDLAQARQAAEVAQAEFARALGAAVAEKQLEIEQLQQQNAELAVQLNGKVAEHSKEHMGLQVKLDAMQKQFVDKERQLQEGVAQQQQLSQQKEHELLGQLEAVRAAEAGKTRQLETEVAGLKQQLAAKEQQLQGLASATAAAASSTQQQQELLQRIDTLSGDVAAKDKELQQAKLTSEQQHSREQELLQQLQEQREKNNDLRMKNWKLIEALQNAEATPSPKQNKTLTNANANLVQQEQLLAAANAQKANALNAASNTAKEEKQIRELFHRLYPEAVKECAATSLSLPFDQWVEQVLAMQVQQALKNTAHATTSTTPTSSSHKATQSNGNNSNHNSHSTNSNSSNELLNSEIAHLNNNSNKSNSNSKNSSKITTTTTQTTITSSDTATAELQKLQLLNAQLRAKNDELTKLVTKTSNTLSDLEGHAREQEEHWRSVVSAKDEQISLLQHSNGEQHNDI